MGDLWKIPLGRTLAKNGYSISDAGEDHHGLFHKAIAAETDYNTSSLLFRDDDDPRWLGSRVLTQLWNAKQYEIDYDISVGGKTYTGTYNFNRGKRDLYEDGVLDSSSGTAITKDDLRANDSGTEEVYTRFRHEDTRQSEVDDSAIFLIDLLLYPETIRWQPYSHDGSDFGCWSIAHTFLIRFDGETGYSLIGSYGDPSADGDFDPNQNILGGQTALEQTFDDEGDITINDLDVLISDCFDWST